MALDKIKYLDKLKDIQNQIRKLLKVAFLFFAVFIGHNIKNIYIKINL